MNDNKNKTNERFPHLSDHQHHQQAVRAKALRHQSLDSAEAVVDYLVRQIQRKYRAGVKHGQVIEAKIGFPLEQISGLTLPSDVAGHDPVKRQKHQLKRLEEVFLPLIDQAIDRDQVIGETTIYSHGKGCRIISSYQVRTPKQFRQ